MYINVYYIYICIYIYMCVYHIFHELWMDLYIMCIYIYMYHIFHGLWMDLPQIRVVLGGKKLVSGENHLCYRLQAIRYPHVSGIRYGSYPLTKRDAPQVATPK